MKMIKNNVLFAASFATILMSCQTTQKAAENQQTTAIEEQISEPELPVITPAQQFVIDNTDIILSVTSAPKSTVKKRAFSKPYIVQVQKNGSTLADYKVAITYPTSRDGDSISFTTTIVATAADGTVSFTPEAPQYSFDSEITFQPAVNTSDPEIVKEAALMSTKAPFKVSTNYTGKGGILSLVDSDSNGSPSSSKLLKHLMNNGFYNVGNVDFARQIKTGDQKVIYEAAHKLVGNSVGFFIYGTINYENAIEKTADGYTCSLTGDIYCLEMATGKQLYATKRTVTVTAQTQWQLIDKARDTLTEEIAHAVIYGM